MTCEEFSKMLDNYESLTDSEKLALNEHAGECAQCRDELDFMLAIIKQLNTLPKIQPPADFAAKLNERLDSEKPGIGGFDRVLASVRRNYKQYSTVAACLVLAVIIGANGKTLLDRIPADTDAVPGVTATDSPSAPTPIAAEFAEVPFVTDNGAASDGGQQVTAERRSVETASAGGNITFIQSMSESINQVDMSNIENQPAPAYDTNMSDMGRSVSGEDAAMETVSSEPNKSSSKRRNYTIARGVYRLPDERIAQEESGISAMSQDEVLQISEIDGRGDKTIARGRYYIPADEGNISVNTDNEIGVNSADAERAEELIQQYANRVDDLYYVIDAESIPSMLEHMEGEGIDYQSKVNNADNEEVSFKLVIE